jgi:hypothetical protein
LHWLLHIPRLPPCTTWQSTTQAHGSSAWHATQAVQQLATAHSRHAFAAGGGGSHAPPVSPSLLPTSLLPASLLPSPGPVLVGAAVESAGVVVVGVPSLEPSPTLVPAVVALLVIVVPLPLAVADAPVSSPVEESPHPWSSQATMSTLCHAEFRMCSRYQQGPRERDSPAAP